MAADTIVAGLDLGTSRIKCVVAVRHEDGQTDIIGTGIHPAKGVLQGAVVNQEDVVHSIRAAVEEAEMMAGCEINEVFISISGRHVESFNSDGMVRIQGEKVTTSDIEAVIDMARAVRLPPNREVLHVVPQGYVIDGQPGISRPLGMSGVRLEVRAHLVIGCTNNSRAFEACCEAAGLRVVDIILAPLAQAEALLTPQSRDLGVLLIDIGGDTTDIAIFYDGAIVHSAMLPIGGDHITADIKDCLNTPTVEAEHLKQMHGSVIAPGLDTDETVEVPGVGGRRARQIKRTHLCEIIDARTEEMLKLVSEELQQIGFQDGLPGGVVLTGGTANLKGLSELTETVLGMQAAVSTPTGLSGLVSVVDNPRYATATGLVLCGLNQRHTQWFSQTRRGTKKGWFLRLFSVFGGQ